MKSSRYIPRDRSHMRTTELKFGAVMDPKKTDNDNSVPLILERNAFVCIVFERRFGQ